MLIKTWYIYTIEVYLVTKKDDTIKFIISVDDG